MMAVSTQTLAAGFLRVARTKEDPIGWLDGLHTQAVAALAVGDTHVSMTALDGASSTIERRFDASQLLEVTTLCLETLEAEQANTAAPGSVRYGDFSGTKSVWG